MKLFLAASAVAYPLFSSIAVAATYSASFSGDVCSIPPAIEESGDSNCSVIEQSDSPKGVFMLELTGLDPNISGPAKITISSSAADLFRNDEQGGAAQRNNVDEYFGLALDSLNLGILFDDTTSDEAAINTELAASVQANIDATGDRSAAPINLMFSLPELQAAGLVADGGITAVFNFAFPSDPFINVNVFFDPSVTVEYETRSPAVVPVPASLPLLAAGLFGLGFVARRRTSLGSSV